MKHLFFLIFFLLTVSLRAQNLVPNGSFENNTGCPNNYEQIYLANGWKGFSADYYNSCSTNGYGIPINFCGKQNAANGNAYCGIVTYLQGNAYREFVEIPLISTLSIGTKYFASIKVNLSSDSCSLSKSNNIGILFSTVNFNDSNSAPLINFAQIYSATIISDTSNWVLISGSFIADSAYQYIIIGNFFDNNHTVISGNTGYAYYYIDDVCVSTDSLECDLGTDINYNLPDRKINFYPTPANAKIYFQTNGNEGIQVSLINILGREIKTYNLGAETSIDVTAISTGIYFLKIITNNEMVIHKQLIIH